MRRRVRPRWLGALLGGIVLPFDPVLGMVMLLISLGTPKARRRIRSLPR